MKSSEVIALAIVKHIPVSVSYCLGNKDLGEYLIKQEFPQTILLSPVDEIRGDIWIPNPHSLESKYVCTVKDANYFRIEIFESQAHSSTNALIWRLKFHLEDLL